MTVKDYEKLRSVNFKDKSLVSFEPNDFFLTPELEESRYGKRAGDTVTVYMITEVKSNGNIVYMPKYLTLTDY
jgi:hypothetical protein